MGTDLAIDIAARISGTTVDVAGRVTGAIRDAARKTGAGFEYLLNTALRESNLNPNAKAKTSSATGLFQFIDQTWLGTIKQSGASLGYGKYANAITRTPSGRFVVNDPAMRQEIMALRKDPAANAVMAGAFANSNAKFLKERLGRNPSDGELYIAHFLGASGAARFISAAEARPDVKAANLFPRAARANGSIFYDRAGGARSLKQVYAGLVAKHDVIGTSRFAARPVEATKKVAAATQPAALAAPLPTGTFRELAPVKAAASVAPAAQVAPPAPVALAARVVPPAPVASVTPASRVADAHQAVAAPVKITAVPPSKAVMPVADVDATAVAMNATGSVPSVSTYAPEPRSEGPMFQTLFHSGERGAVAPVVRELWGTRRAAASEPAAAPADAAAGAAINAPLDLFRFLRPSVRRPA